VGVIFREDFRSAAFRAGVRSRAAVTSPAPVTFRVPATVRVGMLARAAVTSRCLSRSADTARPCGSARIESSRRAQLHRRGHHIAGATRSRSCYITGPPSQADTRSRASTPWQSHTPSQAHTVQGYTSSRARTTASHPIEGSVHRRHIDSDSLTRTTADPGRRLRLHYPALRRRNAGEIRTPSGPVSTTPAS